MRLLISALWQTDTSNRICRYNKILGIRTNIKTEKLVCINNHFRFDNQDIACLLSLIR